ncbi:MAG: 7-carboxy-7-deazaguanine synthase QueE [Candidatus Omnitrophica bacterium]|nr:7-carboxy-7-deazaguanine synthase QueE [Candidatus Omnitrophota bacterium]
MSDTARIIEIFPSIQGEGIYVGMPHLFVRFWNCNMACHYCDTDYRGPYREMTREELLLEVEAHLEREGPFQAVSLTGGEPLLWWKFLKGWLPPLKGLGQRVYLETNGTLPEALKELLPWIDTIAMDLKPPTAANERPLWAEHEAFLLAAVRAQRDLFVKIVVTRETTFEDLQRAFDLVARVDPKIPVVLQPVTPFREVHDSPPMEQVEQWRRQGASSLADLRVIPQVHRMLGVP